MCGRCTLSVSVDEIWEELDLEGDPPAEGREALVPRYNIAPTQLVPAIVDRKPKELVRLRWGLVPFWADSPSIGNRMINARAETLADKPAFRRAFDKRRCLIVADGFYEWKRVDGKKVPHYVRLKSHRPFAFAGLYEFWRPEEGVEPLRSCTIVTTKPAAILADIHDRMPVILPPGAREKWLEGGTREELSALLAPIDSDALELYPVSPMVGSPKNDTPELIEPVG